VFDVVHEHAPHANICFNTTPSDTADAVTALALNSRREKILTAMG
jgi:hypothetical protein